MNKIPAMISIMYIGQAVQLPFPDGDELCLREFAKLADAWDRGKPDCEIETHNGTAKIKVDNIMLLSYSKSQTIIAGVSPGLIMPSQPRPM